jgi:hypothetical protein
LRHCEFIVKVWSETPKLFRPDPRYLNLELYT